MANWAPMDEERFYIWLAGFVDGEGQITILQTARDTGVMLSISNTNEEVIHYIQQRLKVGSVFGRTSTKTNHKQVFYYSVTHLKAVLIIENIMPYLRVKYRRAQIALDFQNTVGYTGRSVPEEIKVRREQLISEMRELNSRGVKVDCM